MGVEVFVQVGGLCPGRRSLSTEIYVHMGVSVQGGSMSEGSLLTQTTSPNPCTDKHL